MSVLNGYATLQNVKDWLNSKGLTTDATDDAVIETIIGAASRYIDGQINTQFYTVSETHYFDAPKRIDDILFFDDELASITSITNGDGSTIPSTAYVMYPANALPYYGVQMLRNAGTAWLTKNGSPQQAIAVAGTWGNVAAAPDDIKTACVLIAVGIYRRRKGENTTGKTIITSGGVVVMPDDVPGIAADIINNHRRNAIG